eukprot:jgi/Orpsp1_1/1183151/evm.model.c7180000084102.1
MKLPLKDNGYPNIDYENYILNKNNINNIFQCSSTTNCIFKIFNDDSYLNLMKILYTLSKSDTSSNVDEKFMVLINIFGKNIKIDENGKFNMNEENDYDPLYKNKLTKIHDYFSYNYTLDVLIFNTGNNDYYNNDSQINTIYDYDFPTTELIGYPCCSPKPTTIYSQDEYGNWSFDFSKNEWCGLTKYEDSLSKNNDNECWSISLGYPCCIGCKVYEKDSDGEWGYELNHWCGILTSNCKY